MKRTLVLVVIGSIIVTAGCKIRPSSRAPSWQEQQASQDYERRRQHQEQRDQRDALAKSSEAEKTPR
jgi:hypothetical protein